MRIGIKTKLKISNEYDFLPATDDFFDLLVAESSGYYKPTTLKLEVFNRKLGKTRKKGEYVKSHLINVRKQLLNCPCIKVLEKLGTWSYQVVIIPFDDVQKSANSDEKMNAPDVVVEAENQDSDVDTELIAEDAGIDQQQLIQVNSECREAGIEYDRHSLPVIASYGLEAVKKSIFLYKRSLLTNKILNPEGWLRACLTRGWFKRVKDVDSDDCLWMLRKLEQFADLCISRLGTIPSNVLDSITKLNQMGLYPPPVQTKN